MTRYLFLAACLAFECGACGGSPKPCPVAIQTKFTAAIVAECGDAGSYETCKAFPALKAAHELEQEDAGCRVKP